MTLFATQKLAKKTSKVGKVFLENTLTLMVLVLLVLSLDVGAGLRDEAAHILGQLERDLEDPLPTAKDILGFDPPLENKIPGFVLGNSRNTSEDGHNWATAIQVLWTWHGLLRTYKEPEHSWPYRDLDFSGEGIEKKQLGRSQESMALAAERYGEPFGVTLDVSQEGKQLEIVLHFWKFGVQTQYDSRAWRIALTSIRETLPDMTEWLETKMGFPSRPDRKPMTNIWPLDGSDPTPYAQLIGWWINKQRTPDVFAQIQSLKESHQESFWPELAEIGLKFNDDAYLWDQKMIDLVARFSGNPALTAYIALRLQGQGHQFSYKRINLLRQTIKDYPQNPLFYLRLAENYCWVGETSKCMSLAIDGIRRWPLNYRSWWNFAWISKKFGWFYRGNDYWNQIPEKGKRVFVAMSQLRRQAIDILLKIHPRIPNLWVLHLNSRNGYDAEMMRSYRQAIKLDPGFKAAYQDAMNFASKKWGGNRAAQAEIIADAEKNNPDQEWVRKLKQDYGFLEIKPIPPAGPVGKIQILSMTPDTGQPMVAGKEYQIEMSVEYTQANESGTVAMIIQVGEGMGDVLGFAQTYVQENSGQATLESSVVVPKGARSLSVFCGLYGPGGLGTTEVVDLRKYVVVDSTPGKSTTPP